MGKNIRLSTDNGKGGKFDGYLLISAEKRKFFARNFNKLD
jgi:hypothetical protein